MEQAAGRKLQTLARQLRRPPATLAAFAALPPEQLAALAEAVDARIAANQRELETALAGLLPGPPGRWLLAWLRRGAR